MRPLTVFNVAALLACALLGAWVYQEARQPVPSLPPPPQASVTLAPATVSAPTRGPAFRMAPKNAFNQLVARPPFSPSRRPPRAKPPEPKAVAAKPATPAPVSLAEPAVTLVGILINPDKSIAMVRKPGAAELLRLVKGEDLDGWRVEGVLPDRLLLSHGEKLLELELTEAAQNETPAQSQKAGARARRQ